MKSNQHSKQRWMVLATVAAALGAPALSARAQSEELARVVSSTPIYEQVQVPKEVCADQQVVSPPKKTGAGAVLGAVAGGAVGNAIGAGTGRAAATALGLVGGGVLGHKIEGGTTSEVKTVRTCNIVNTIEQRPIGYNVTYEYAGKQYTMQSATDPGSYVRLSVTPMS